MFAVVAAGELLIDFTPAGYSAGGEALFEQNPGGAPANVLVGLSRLGHKTAFIGKVGQDHFGHFLQNVLLDNKVDCQGLALTDQCKTTLAFVHLDKDGDRSFSFYRNPGADTLLSREDIPLDLLRQTEIFHFGSVSLTAEPARSATLYAASQAKEAGCLVSYDPNLRLMLWPDSHTAKKTILAAMDRVDILKISEEELFFLTGLADLEQGAAWFFKRFDLVLVLITLGPGGAYAATRENQAWQPAYAVKTIDTTGAGDAFTAAFLDRLLQKKQEPGRLTAAALAEYLAFANAAGSLATTRTGAIPALPNEKEIQDCLDKISP